MARNIPRRVSTPWVSAFVVLGYKLVRTVPTHHLMISLARHLWLKHKSVAAFEVFTVKPITGAR
jgi:hypothetical protein